MSDPDLVVVAEFQARVEAELAQGALANAGIESILSSDDVGGQYAGIWVDGIRLLVHPDHRDLAREVLDTSDPPPLSA